MNPIYSIIVPVYNEEAVLGETYTRLTGVMRQTGEPYEIIFINDGSKDASAAMIKDMADRDNHIKMINFSRNFGHQPAITAGMDYASGEAAIVIDADLQDPPEIILKMIEKWKEGYEVVYGKRIERRGETFFKKATSKLYYRFLRSMTNVDIPQDTGDFRLIDRKVLLAMRGLTEKNRYVRGLVSWVGFKQTQVEYIRDKRFAGETKYPFKKMLALAVNGITSFSYKPLKLATTAGFMLSLCGFIYMVIVVFQKLFTDTTIQGWASMIIILLLTQGIVLIVLGLVGEYIGRIYDETKNRPVYIISERLGFEDEIN